MLKNYEEKLNYINSLVYDMSQKILNAHKIALSSFEKKDTDEFEAVFDLIKNIDLEARAIDNEVVKTIALFGPEASQLRELLSYIKLTNEIVRVGDYAKTYVKNILPHIKKEINMDFVDSYIIKLYQTAIKAIDYALSILNEEDKDKIDSLYRKTLVEESKTDEIFSLFEKELLENICKNTDEIKDYINILAICRKLERAADRAVEIAKILVFAKKGGQLESF